MSEQNKFEPLPTTAQDSDADLINGGARLNYSPAGQLQLEVTPAQIEAAHSEMDKELELGRIVVSTSDLELASQTSGEAEVDPEVEARLSLYLERGVSALHIAADWSTSEQSVRKAGGGTTFGDGVSKNFTGDRVAAAQFLFRYRREYDAKADITETVSIAKPDPAVETSLRQSLGTDNVTLVQYATVGDNIKYLWGSRGNSIFFGIALPSSEALQLQADIEKDPRAIRRLVERAATEVIGLSEKTWKHNQPPYAEWRKVNNGTMHMQVLTEPTADPKPTDGKVIDF